MCLVLGESRCSIHLFLPWGGCVSAPGCLGLGEVTWTVFPTVFNASLVSVRHPGIIISYLESLALGELFLGIDSCSN